MPWYVAFKTSPKAPVPTRLPKTIAPMGISSNAGAGGGGVEDSPKKPGDPDPPRVPAASRCAAGIGTIAFMGAA